MAGKERRIKNQMSTNEKKYLFKLADNTNRDVYLVKDTGLLYIESKFGSDDFKKEYNRFVDDYRENESLMTRIRDKYHMVQAKLYHKNINLFQRILNKFLPYVPSIKAYGNFLDVGCNTGSILSKLPDEWEKYGVEISKQAYKTAILNKNIEVYNTGLEEFNTEKKFKFIRASHVIEHIIDYDAFFQKIHSLMDKDGYVLFYTPNTKSISYYIFRKYWGQFYEKTHVYLFNLDNLQNICNHHGFEVVEKGTYYMGTTASSITSLLGFESGSRLGQIIFFLFFCLFYPFSYFVNILHLGGAMYIYFKKK